jgi:endonuclease/exonuclease/phosphatase (EEP) superfamily protein YafD
MRVAELSHRERAPGARPISLFDANLHAANPDVASIAEEIRAAAPDLVALQEVDHDAAAGLLRPGVLARFPYAVTEIRNGPPGIALWSRFPLADPEVLDTGGRLQRHRLADAHERRGRGWATTWPRDRWPLPPLMRLDHVLVSPDIGVRSVTEGHGQGSDHRPIIAELVLGRALQRPAAWTEHQIADQAALLW